MKREKITHPAPQEGAASAPATNEAAAAPSQPDFRPINAETPFGEVIRVRGEGIPETQAIRSMTVGWYAPGYSHVLHIKPTEWAPLPTVA
jgi:hypothetical protein